MRSRNGTMEGPDDQPTQGLIHQGENTPGLLKKRLNAPQEEEKRKRCGSLSKKDLLHLLGVMEGEVQVTAATIWPPFSFTPEE